MKSDFILFLVGGVLFALAIALLSINRMAAGVLFAYAACCTASAIWLHTSERRQAQIDALGVDRFVPLYRRVMTWGLTRTLPWFTGVSLVEGDHRGLRQILRDSFTYRLLDRALLIAVIYPLLLLLAHWGISGDAGRLGSVEVIPAAAPYWLGPATLGVIVFALCAPLYPRWAPAPLQRFSRSVGVGLDTVAFCLSLALLIAGRLLFDLPAFALAGAFAVAGALALAFALAGAFALALAFALAGAFAGALALAFAGAFAVVVAWLYYKNHRALAGLVAVVSPLAAVVASVSMVPWDGVSPNAQAVFLFLGVVPILNALFDVLSYGGTLALAQRGLRGGAIWFGLMDLFWAVVLFLALGATLVSVVAWMERTSGAEFVDLDGVLAQAGDFGTYWWLYAILFSTALPTVVHGMIAALSLQACAEKRLRDRLAHAIARMGQDDPLPDVLGVFGLGAVWFASLALPAIALCALGWTAWTLGLEWALEQYLNWLFTIAAASGGN